MLSFSLQNAAPTLADSAPRARPRNRRREAVSQSAVAAVMTEPLRPALAVSVLVHVAVLGVAMLLTVRQVQPAAVAHGGASVHGETFDVDEVLQARKQEPAAEPAPRAEPAPAGDSVPVVKPVVRKPRKETSAKPDKPEPAGEGPSAAAATASPPGSSGGEPAASPSAGTAGADPGVANLAKAFAKAVTAATHKDPTWDELPLGSAGSVRVAVHVDAEGRIERSLVAERDEAPAHLVKLVDRTLLLLRAGRFALSKGEAKAGSETLRIEVTLSSVEAQEDYEDPRHTVAMGFEPPRPGQPGRAYFVHAAGRRFDAKISIE